MDDRPDLAELAEHVRTIHWHGLGLQLGLENDDLSSISLQCSITEGCRTEMFNSWLKKSINATRRQLLEALRSSAVAEIHMAECYEKYIFGLSRRGGGGGLRTEGVSPRKRNSQSSQSTDIDVPHLKAQKANTHLEHWCLLDVFTKPHTLSHTGIICTIGPASQTVDVLEKLITAGMTIARMNLSHGNHHYHKVTIDNIREAAERVPDKNIAIALDTKGPEIHVRTGLLKGGGSAKIELNTGDKLVLTTEENYYEIGETNNLYVDYKNITKVLERGDIVYIDDGLISLKVIEKTVTTLTTIVQNGGALGSRKGINLPKTVVDLPALSNKDEEDLNFCVEQGVDMVFASFIRRAEDVHEVRKQLGEKGKNIRIISKIENQEGVENFDEILQVTDGIMVSRGDLGIEIPPEKVFLAQKMMIGRCNRLGKPVIVATQMLESMVSKPRPTRAETSDVANAVLDGADCVMLSGETAKGKYPEKTVEMMRKICCESEAAIFHRVVFDELRLLTPKPTETVVTTAIAAVDAAFSQNAAAILCLTTTGRTAFMLARYRPRCPIIAITTDKSTARLCHLHRGIHPLFYQDPHNSKPWEEDMEKRFQYGANWGRTEGFIQKGSSIVVVSGWESGPANTYNIRIFE